MKKLERETKKHAHRRSTQMKDNFTQSSKPSFSRYTNPKKERNTVSYVSLGIPSLHAFNVMSCYVMILTSINSELSFKRAPASRKPRPIPSFVTNLSALLAMVFVFFWRGEIKSKKKKDKSCLVGWMMMMMMMSLMHVKVCCCWGCVVVGCGLVVCTYSVRACPRGQ